MDYEYEKRLIGLLISYTRKKLNQQYGGTQYTQIGLIKAMGKGYLENCALCQSPCHKDKICSKNILIEIEKGIPYKKECYYVGLIENLGYIYRCDEKIVKEIQQIEDKLVFVLGTYQLPDILNVNQMIDKAIKKYNGVFYFSSLLQIYKALILFMLENQQPKNIDEDFLYLLFENGNTQIKEVVSILIYETHLNLSTEMKDILNDKDKPHLFSYHLQYLRQNESHSLVYSSEKLNELAEAEYNQLNEYNKYKLHDSLAFVYLNSFDLEKAKQHLIHCSTILENKKNQFPNYFILQLLNHLGLVSYLTKNYIASINYFLTLYKLDISQIYGNIILLYNMLEKQDRIAELKELLSKDYYRQIHSPQAKTIFRYYELKYSKPMSKALACELEEMIIDSLLLESTIHSDIITDELNELINLTKNYKNYLIYTQRLKKLQSN